jgi:hypothetical protein
MPIGIPAAPLVAEALDAPDPWGDAVVVGPGLGLQDASAIARVVTNMEQEIVAFIGIFDLF